MELEQCSPSVNYTVCPDGRNVVVTPPEQKNFEETQSRGSADDTAESCGLCLSVVAGFLILFGVVFTGIFLGTGDGVNRGGVPHKEMSRPFLYIGITCLVPGIICILVSIPLIRRGRNHHQRRVERNTYRDLPNYEHSPSY